MVDALPMPRRLLLVGMTAILGLATVGTFFIEPLLAPVPVLGVGAAYALWKMPVRHLALGMYAVAISVDMISENAFVRLWKSPLNFPGRLFYEQLNSVTGIGALHFPLVDLLVVGVIALYAYRRATGKEIDDPVTPLPLPLVLVTPISLITILIMEVHGVLTGGDVQNSLWQWHQLAFVPLLVWVFNIAIRGPEDHPTIMKIVVAGSFIKSILGAWFIVMVAHPSGKDPEYATCHSDSLTFVLALLMGLTPWLEKQTMKRFLRMAIIWGGTFIGLFYNDRRLAYVSLGGSIFTIFMLSPWTKLKRFIVRSGFIAAPLLAAYIGVGWNIQTGVFKPVHIIYTLLNGEHATQDESDLDYRDIENWDVMNTWNLSPIFGHGYGHEFVEPIKLPDIAFVFPQYRFHPHNSFLGTFAWGGPVGASGVWLYIAVTVFMAARAYHRAHPPDWRAACLVIVCYVACYLNQCFGDMGTISWIGAFHMGVAVACAGKLAVRTGAWPAPQRSTARLPAQPVSVTATAPLH